MPRAHLDTALPRPCARLTKAGQRYPRAWNQIAQFRADRGKDLPDWPDYVYAPMAAWYAAVSAEAGVARLPLDRVLDVGLLSALGAWRMTKGLYRFDPDLLEALWDTPVTGDVPVEVLHRLPEWCVYIETPGRTWQNVPLHGFWAHLEEDANDRREELRLLLDTDQGLIPIPLHLTGTLEDGLRSATAEIRRQWNRSGQRLSWDDTDLLESAPLAPLVSLCLYLCAENAELGDGTTKPRNPVPRKVKGGLKLFAAGGPTRWEIGVRLGAALRRAHSAPVDAPGETGTAASPRAHIRRAHWHTYRTGPRRAGATLKWLAPIAVNVDDAEALPALIKPLG